MDNLAGNAGQLVGFGFGAAAVTALALLANSIDHADKDELDISCGDALDVALQQPASGSDSLPLVMGIASVENTNSLISALAAVGVEASIFNDTTIVINASRFLDEQSSHAEIELYERLVKSGLVLTPGRRVGNYMALRVHYDGETIKEIVKRFVAFGKSSATIESHGSVPPSPAVERVNQDSEVEKPTSPAQTPAHVPPTIDTVQRTKTVTKTTGRGRKRRVSDDEAENESVQTETAAEAVRLAVSAVKTPAVRRKSVAVDNIQGDVASTTRKSRRSSVN